MYPQPIRDLVEKLSKLPDIGPRAATRLVFYFLNQPQTDLTDLGRTIHEIKKKIHLCQRCFNIADISNDLCAICSARQRDHSTIAVVETVLNIPAIEKTNKFQGTYHVLGGLISPGSGLGPDKLKINELITRARDKQIPIKEIIFALSPTTEGDTTYLYIQKQLAPLKIKISRLARGLATGSDLEYIDENTLSNAFANRR